MDIEVVDSDTTPNVLSRESTFVMGILKPCFVLKKEGKQIPVQIPIPKVNNPTPIKQVEGHSSKNSTTPRSARSKPPYNLNGKVDLSRPLTEVYIKSKYFDIFEGLGWFPGEPYSLKLKPDSTPAKHRPRKVPVHLEEAFHEEINQLCKIDVLEPVKEHTDWVNSYVIVEKDVQIDSSNAHSPGHSIKRNSGYVSIQKT